MRLAIRPERVRFAEVRQADALAATVESQIYLGDHQRLLLRLAEGQQIAMKIEADRLVARGQKISLIWSAKDCRAYSAVGNS